MSECQHLGRIIGNSGFIGDRFLRCGECGQDLDHLPADHPFVRRIMSGAQDTTPRTASHGYAYGGEPIYIDVRPYKWETSIDIQDLIAEIEVSSGNSTNDGHRINVSLIRLNRDQLQAVRDAADAILKEHNA